MNSKTKTTKEKIKSVLWAGANTFRGLIDAANYKDYILTMLFIKYLDDTFEENVENLRIQYKNNELRVQRAITNLPFTLEEEARFRYLYENRFDSKIGEKINAALSLIEDSNAELRGIFRSINFNSEASFGNVRQKNTRLRSLLEDFFDLDLTPINIEVKEGEVPADVLGDAYEYMIGEFARMAGQKAGSFFTPMMVSELMARIVSPQANESVYDPTMGSASLLIRAAKQVDLHHVAIFGQEMNGSSYSMARMNLFIHDIHGANVQWGDTLANPLHLDNDGNLMQFNAIVANMPFSQDKWAEGFNPGGEVETIKGKKVQKFKMDASLDRFHRFDIGVPPSGKGDWAFLLHMIASLRPNGRMAAVVPHGVLFRGASEGKIRKSIIEKNLLDAVIGLPENLFFGTSIPACVLVFKKGKSTSDVMFIDASTKDKDGNNRYVKDKNQNKLEEKDIAEIFEVYTKRKSVDKFAYTASLDEIAENDYNLNIPRYVDSFEDEAEIDINQVRENIAKIKSELSDIETQLDEYLKELGL